MPVKPITTEFGHSLPPEKPHNITLHAKGWATAMAFRDGDMAILSRLTSMYPRFGPWAQVRQLAMDIAAKLGLPQDFVALPFMAPDVLAAAKAWATSPRRKDDKLAEGDLTLRAVDVGGTRLYIVACPVAKSKGIVGIWQHPGNGISTRLAEALLQHKDSIEVVPFDGEHPPPPTYLPESEAHAGLRERIAGLLREGAIDPAKAEVTPGDVYLYPTGMAAIYRAHQVLTQVSPGTVVALGALFRNTWLLLEEDGGLKHFGRCDAQGRVVEEVEAFLEEEAKAGRKISYVFLEFPSNPSLVSADLEGLRALADKHAFPLVVDDTVGSFCNLDLASAADVIVTSLTKSFSGYADVMAGSVVLNPASPRHAELKPALSAAFRNEFFAGDAAVLLANSRDYLARSATLNRNAAALAARLQRAADDPASPVTGVMYPPQSDTLARYRAFMRRPAAGFAPGYGCLLSVDFEDVPGAAAFYDHLEVHQGPHLGAHRTLALPYNATQFGGDAAAAAYHAAYGLREASLRISAGLEDAEDLLAAVELALAEAAEAKAEGARA